MVNILITGSSSGFGELTAKTLAKKGHHVFASMRDISGRNAEKGKALEEWAKSEDVALEVVELDVGSDDSVEKAIKSIIDSRKEIDVVVNNAGFGIGGVLESFTADDLQKQFNVNVYGPHRVTRTVLPHMRGRKSGLIIYISSAGGRIVFPGFGAYVASKWALEALAESYRDEIQQFGIDTAIVEPGAYPTDFFGNMEQSGDKERLAPYEEFLKQQQKMFGGIMELFKSDKAPDPQEIADAIVKLVEMPAGSRPLRTAVGMGTAGIAEYNEQYVEAQKKMFSSLG